jgi:hypothetical protein
VGRPRDTVTAAPSAAFRQTEAEIDSDAQRLTAMYKDIHQNAELGLMETRTAEIVAKQLKDLGFEVQTGIGKTGVAGVLRNGRARRSCIARTWTPTPWRRSPDFRMPAMCE